MPGERLAGCGAASVEGGEIFVSFIKLPNPRPNAGLATNGGELNGWRPGFKSEMRKVAKNAKSWEKQRKEVTKEAPKKRWEA